MKISKGLQEALALAAISELDGTVVKIYGSPTSQSAADALIPTNAYDAIGSATLLATISVDGGGTGVTFETSPINGVIYKNTAETWVGDIVASGYASFYRMELAADDGSSSTSAVRVQGTVGVVGKDLILASAYLTLGQEQRIDSFVLAVPLQ
jgi:hypothetical protein